MPRAYPCGRAGGLAEEGSLRQKNWRVAGTGLGLIVLAAMFSFGMATMASGPRVNDPVALMPTVGVVSGAAAGIGLVMFVFGMIGRKVG